jgi:predicted nucleic acid-binding protein
MVVADSSSLIEYLGGGTGPDIDLIDEGLRLQTLHLVPPILTELLSDPALDVSVRDMILLLPVLPILDGYWERAGGLRSRLIARGRKAKLADSLIAQACIDHDAEIISRDADFRAFRPEGLKLLP